MDYSPTASGAVEGLDLALLVESEDRDVVGLYVDPPERAVVDYKRHGTTTLFAALDVEYFKLSTDPHFVEKLPARSSPQEGARWNHDP